MEGGHFLENTTGLRTLRKAPRTNKKDINVNGSNVKKHTHPSIYANNLKYENQKDMQIQKRWNHKQMFSVQAENQQRNHSTPAPYYKQRTCLQQINLQTYESMSPLLHSRLLGMKTKGVNPNKKCEGILRWPIMTLFSTHLLASLAKYAGFPNM